MARKDRTAVNADRANTGLAKRSIGNAVINTDWAGLQGTTERELLPLQRSRCTLLHRGQKNAGLSNMLSSSPPPEQV